ncbi:MAG: hypothetical protein JWR75_1928 [Devosia sp.]|nr:hypothetical protein [Devosia sp.]
MSQPVAPIEERQTFGIGLLLSSHIFLTLLDGSAKWLAVSGMPTTEIVFMRYGVHVALILLLFLPREGRGLFRSNNLLLEILRGLCLLGSTLGNFVAMRYLPLPVTGALIFTMPLMVCALSGPLLGEQVGWRRWLAICIGFVGILIIVRPGTAAFHPAAIFSLCAALAGALYSILTRKLAGVDSVATQQFYAGATALLFVSPFAMNGWVWPDTGASWFAFFALGVGGMLGHQFQTTAHRYATPSTLAPFNYMQLFYLALLSWLLFQQPPEIWFYVGAPFIIGSGLYIWLREQQLARVQTALIMAD